MFSGWGMIATEDRALSLSSFSLAPKTRKHWIACIDRDEIGSTSRDEVAVLVRLSSSTLISSRGAFLPCSARVSHFFTVCVGYVIITFAASTSPCEKHELE